MDYKIVHNNGDAYYEHTIIIPYSEMDDDQLSKIKKWCAATFSYNWKYVHGMESLIIYLASDRELNMFRLRWS
jgi:hypothetical protein